MTTHDDLILALDPSTLLRMTRWTLSPGSEAGAKDK